MTNYPEYPAVDSQPRDQTALGLFRWAVRAAGVVKNMARGRMNVVADLTLDAGMTSTVLVHPNLHAFAAISLDPLTEAAAAALTGIYAPEDSRNNAQWVLNHPAAAADCRFRVIILG